MIEKILLKIYRGIAKTNRFIFINKANRVSLKNRDFTILSSNCIGGCILHDLNLRFLTPTINLFFSATDFMKFLENIDFYLNQKIEFANELSIGYPIGQLGDIKIHFVHYKDEQSAKRKWEERSRRINANNVYVIMTDRDDCNEEIFRRFDNLSYKNKVLFTSKKHKEYPSTFYIKGFENQNQVGDLTKYENIFGKKYYDEFDFINWFNTK